MLPPERIVLHGDMNLRPSMSKDVENAISFVEDGICHGFVLWMDWILDARNTVVISTGPVFSIFGMPESIVYMLELHFPWFSSLEHQGSVGYGQSEEVECEIHCEYAFEMSVSFEMLVFFIRSCGLLSVFWTSVL
ncbi:Protein arginine N-methyltransferase 7 [Linum perenne]